MDVLSLALLVRFAVDCCESVVGLRRIKTSGAWALLCTVQRLFYSKLVWRRFGEARAESRRRQLQCLQTASALGRLRPQTPTGALPPNRTGSVKRVSPSPEFSLSIFWSPNSDFYSYNLVLLTTGLWKFSPLSLYCFISDVTPALSLSIDPTLPPPGVELWLWSHVQHYCTHKNTCYSIG